MGWIKVACAVAAGAVAVKAVKTVIEADDPGVLVAGAVVSGVSGATAYSLAKSEIRERREEARLTYEERKRIGG